MATGVNDGLLYPLELSPQRCSSQPEKATARYLIIRHGVIDSLLLSGALCAVGMKLSIYSIGSSIFHTLHLGLMIL